MVARIIAGRRVARRHHDGGYCAWRRAHPPGIGLTLAPARADVDMEVPAMVKGKED